MTTRYVFDIESDALLAGNPSVIWCAVVKDIATNEKWLYSDFVQDANPLSKLTKRLEKADQLIGHNIIGYDLIVIERILKWKSPITQKKIDTLLMSQSLDQRRFGYEGHSLERWGQHFKCEKLPIEDDAWRSWDPRYPERCDRDVEINHKTYNYLMKELKAKAGANPLQRVAIAAEHFTAEFMADAQEAGWPFDRPAAVELLGRMDKELAELEAKLEPQMPLWIKPKKLQKEEEGKERIGVVHNPVFNKNGKYNHHTVNYFKEMGVTAEDALKTDWPGRPIDGPFTLIVWEKGKLSSTEHLKRWITKLGWVPLQYNTKKVGRVIIETSPKLCEVSLHALGDIGVDIDNYNSTSSRASILRNWILGLDTKGRIHGESKIIGTPTFRLRHQIVTNVPSPDAKWGKEVRELFICDPGWVIVGADSAGNQARGLCHYVGNEAFTKRYLSADLHDQNAKILKCTRKQAKTFIYAYLFGAADKKLGIYLTNQPNERVGAKARSDFQASLPGLEDLLEHLSQVFESSKGQVRSQRPDGKFNQGYVPDLAGRRVYSDSPHKLLNYLLQSAEAITCKAALMYTVKKLREEGIEYQPLIMYHDEIQVMVRPRDAKRVAEIMEEGFREAPKEFGVMIMDGEAKIGQNWYECH